MNSAVLHAGLDQLVAQQDYLWFVAALAWVLALGGGGVGPRPGWLIALGAAQVGSAAAAIAHFVTASSDLVQPHRGWEWVAWFFSAAQATALAGGLHRRAPLAVGPVAFGLAAWQAGQTLRLGQDHPVFPGLALALATGLIAAAVARRRRGQPAALLALAVLGTVACCPHGSLAELALEARRWSVLTLFVLPAAGCTLLSALAARAVGDGSGLRAAWLGGTARRSMFRLGAWLALGLVLATTAGTLARRSFEDGLLTRGRAYAGVAIDLPALESWLRDEFKVGPVSVGRGYSRRPVDIIRAPATESATVAPLRRLLRLASPSGGDVRYANVTTLRGGRLIVALFPKSERDPPGIAIDYGQATAADLAAWAERRSYVAPLATVPRGALVRARTALIAPSGLMLGWLSLDVSAARWFAVQGQARVQVLAFVALGVVLIFLADRHRARLEEKVAAERTVAEAAAADAAKNAFLAQVSHELRTPVQSVLGFGELLAATDLDDRQREWLRAQRSHGELLLRLVNDLLDTMSLQQGTFRLDPRPDNLRTAVQEAIETWRARAEAKGLELSVTLRAESGLAPDFDRARVRQVIHNLVGNAIKFTPAGRIAVTFELGAFWDKAIACSLTVADSGPGIPEAQRARLFEPFSRLDTARQTEGAGLGLAIARQLCRTMDGDLILLPDSGRGATFLATWRFRCAADAQKSPEQAPASVAAPLLAGMRVLVADDNPFVRQLLREGLGANGAVVETAQDGAETLAKAHDERFDALVVDLSMPHLEGDEVARRLRQRGSRLRIVGLSAHANPKDRDRALAAGIDIFLSKPASLATLCANLRPSPPERAAAPEAPLALSALRQRLREDFLDSRPATLAQLELLRARRDWPALARQAHHLKGSADVLDLPGLSAACAALFAAAESRLPERADTACACVATLLHVRHPS